MCSLCSVCVMVLLFSLCILEAAICSGLYFFVQRCDDVNDIGRVVETFV